MNTFYMPGYKEVFLTRHLIVMNLVHKTPVRYRLCNSHTFLCIKCISKIIKYKLKLSLSHVEKIFRKQIYMKE